MAKLLIKNIELLHTPNGEMQNIAVEDNKIVYVGKDVPADFAADEIVDGIFWQLLAYCAGVGGSMLIVGSAAGVVVMGLEKISFGWYMKKISWIVLPA